MNRTVFYHNFPQGGVQLDLGRVLSYFGGVTLDRPLDWMHGLEDLSH